MWGGSERNCRRGKNILKMHCMIKVLIRILLKLMIKLCCLLVPPGPRASGDQVHLILVYLDRNVHVDDSQTLIMT